MKVLVTGASGFIGSHITETLTKKGFDIRVTDIPKADFSIAENLGAEICPADMTRFDEVKGLLKDVNTVIHCAAIFDFGAPLDLLEKINVGGVENICKAAIDSAIDRMVVLSSVAVYGKPVRTPCREEDPKNPRNHYEKTKWLGEQKALQYNRESGLPVTVLRPTLVYGPRSKYGHAMHFAVLALRKALKKDSLPIMDGGPSFNHVHVSDVSNAALLLATSEGVIGEAYNIVDDTPVHFGEYLLSMMDPLGILTRKKIRYMPWLWKIAVALLRILPVSFLNPINKGIAQGWDVICRRYNLADELRPRLDKDWLDYGTGNHVYDNSKIKSLGFNLQYPNFKDGIRSVIDWYKENRWIP